MCSLVKKEVLKGSNFIIFIRFNLVFSIFLEFSRKRLRDWYLHFSHAEGILLGRIKPNEI